MSDGMGEEVCRCRPQAARRNSTKTRSRTNECLGHIVVSAAARFQKRYGSRARNDHKDPGIFVGTSLKIVRRAWVSVGRAMGNGWLDKGNPVIEQLYYKKSTHDTLLPLGILSFFGGAFQKPFIGLHQSQILLVQLHEGRFVLQIRCRRRRRSSAGSHSYG